MMGAMTLTEFLLARIAEDEAVARLAIDKDRPGTHWQWVTNETDTPVKTGDLTEAQNYQAVSLRTVEEYPTTSGVGPLPAFIISHTEEVADAGDHITRWDPARVLAECEAKRRIVQDRDEDHAADNDEWSMGYYEANYAAMHALAVVYADHPDYLPEWRP